MVTEEKTELIEVEDVYERNAIEDSAPMQPSKKKGTWVAPLKLLSYEKIYYLWIPMIVISFLGVLISWLNLEYKEPFLDGSFYCTFITVMSPYVLEFFVELKVKKKNQVKQNFIYFKITAIALAVCHIFFSALLIGKPLSQNIIFQVIYIVASFFMTLYIYLVFKMDNHPEYLTESMDVPYDEVLKRKRNDMIVSASQTTSANKNGLEIEI